MVINFPLMSILLISAKQLTETQRSQYNKSVYETKSKGNIIVILHNLSFQLLSPYLDVLLQKIYQKDKCCS